MASRRNSEIGAVVPKRDALTDDATETSPEKKNKLFGDEFLDGAHFSVETTTSFMEAFHEWSPRRRFVAQCVKTLSFELGVGVVMLINLIVEVVETNDRAECRSASDSPDDECPETLLLRLAHIALLILYSLEIAARVYVDRYKFFVSWWNISDVAIVFLSLLTELLNGVFPSMSFLRLFRLLRLFRSMRLVVHQRELYIIVHGFVGTMKALFWAAILMIGLLTMWSIVAVEIIHPITQELAKGSTEYASCPRCVRSFSNVWEANLTFFQTVVLMDEWGGLILPVIHHRWWTVLPFMGVTFSVGLGLTNLILAVIVDRAREAHDNDVAAQDTVKTKKMDSAKKQISRLCARMDVDKSGNLCLDELMSGWDESEEFRQVMNVLDVEKDDMECVFRIMDSDGSGDVSYEEFVDNLYRMKSQNSRTLLVFIKFYVLELRRSVEEELQLVKGEILSGLRETARIVKTISGPNSPTSPNRPFYTCEEDIPELTPSKVVTDIASEARPLKSTIEMLRPSTSDDAAKTASLVKLRESKESDRHLDELLESSRDMLRTIATDDVVASTSALVDGCGPVAPELSLNRRFPSGGGRSNLVVSHQVETIPGMPLSSADCPDRPLPTSPSKPANLQHPKSSPPELSMQAEPETIDDSTTMSLDQADGSLPDSSDRVQAKPPANPWPLGE